MLDLIVWGWNKNIIEVVVVGYVVCVKDGKIDNIEGIVY